MKKSLFSCVAISMLFSANAMAGIWSSPAVIASTFLPAPAINGFVSPLGATATVGVPVGNSCNTGDIHRYHLRSGGNWRGPVYYHGVFVYEQKCV